ncbi:MULTISPECIES: DUF6334 family protein [unclassified Sphingomonas]|uniref:DUF6334 family protein n=1 Tax=unclassified Sphingomonas TaxID=196159 RepID=UPI00226AB40D|nr:MULTISPECIES: DUF6334 family protein [unclassified Sphingomonas]
MADRTMLQFDYKDVHGRTVSGVVGRRDGHAGWGSIAFVIDNRAVVLRVDPNTDEVVVTLEDASDLASDWIEVAEIANAIGSALGWCWIGRNYRGYLDMFTLSFSGIDPQICFLGEASTLTIKHIIGSR